MSSHAGSWLGRALSLDAIVTISMVSGASFEAWLETGFRPFFPLLPCNRRKTPAELKLISPRQNKTKKSKLFKLKFLTFRLNR